MRSLSQSIKLHSHRRCRSNNPYRFVRLGIGIVLVTYWAFVFAPPSSAQTSPSNKTLDRGALVLEVTSLVSQYGWRANLGSVCSSMRLGPETDCIFKQIAVNIAPPGTIDNHAFNVPAEVSGMSPDVMIFHLRPFVAYFFVVSSDGKLRSSFYRARGSDYTEIPTSDVQHEFDASLNFWVDILPQLKDQLRSGGAR